MPAEAYTDVELEAAAQAYAEQSDFTNWRAMRMALDAAAPLIAARVRADERARVAEEIRQAIEEADRHVDVTAAEMARTARAHAATPAAEEDPNA